MSERVVVVNAGKMNYDYALDFSILSNDVQAYKDSTNAELIKRIQGARVVVTKELPVSADLLSQFPDTVELIVEAGTGYNNIDLDAAIHAIYARHVRWRYIVDYSFAADAFT